MVAASAGRLSRVAALPRPDHDLLGGGVTREQREVPDDETPARARRQVFELGLQGGQLARLTGDQQHLRRPARARDAAAPSSPDARR
ncbi:MAG TPA: hypothetical protein VM324_12650 [Egibacteraceae bacterium]|nr:hypothetical protein [Egibacteraceae bacterium]